VERVPYSLDGGVCRERGDPSSDFRPRERVLYYQLTSPNVLTTCWSECIDNLLVPFPGSLTSTFQETSALSCCLLPRERGSLTSTCLLPTYPANWSEY